MKNLEENSFIDKNGRVIPSRHLKNKTCKPNKLFQLVRPVLAPFQYRDAYSNFVKAFTTELEYSDFIEKSEHLIKKIGEQKNIFGLLNGVHLPVILPKMDCIDYGRSLEEIFIPAVDKGYKKTFPNKGFIGWDDLADNVDVAPESRHDRLIAEMAKNNIVGIYFPTALFGYSVLASREQMKYLPESLLLAGGVDSAMAMVMYIKILARDYLTPGLDCSALSFKKNDSLHFDTLPSTLEFGAGCFMEEASDDYSSGLVYIGIAG